MTQLSMTPSRTTACTLTHKKLYLRPASGAQCQSSSGTLMSGKPLDSPSMIFLRPRKSLQRTGSWMKCRKQRYGRVYAAGTGQTPTDCQPVMVDHSDISAYVLHVVVHTSMTSNFLISYLVCKQDSSPSSPIPLMNKITTGKFSFPLALCLQFAGIMDHCI